MKDENAVMSSQQGTESLPDIQWETHRDYLQRLLISLTHDIDLAEDLLQDTYLLVRRGWANFRDGDVRAWLATIARNVFYSYCRKRYVRSEVPLDADVELAAPSHDTHLLIELRQTIASLPTALRDALVMKHYGGFSYHEIADRQHCPVGTAKWRVAAAIKRVQVSLGITGKKEIMSMPVPITSLLDYLYGRLPLQKAADIRETLAANAESRTELQTLEGILHLLDDIRGTVKLSEIAVLDADSGVMRYSFIDIAVNSTPETADEADWGFTENVELRAVMLQGQDVPFRVVGQDGENIRYKSPFPQPVHPGDPIGSALLVTYEKNGVRVLDDNCRQFHVGGTVGSNTDSWVFLQMVRLPQGATLITADPPADKVSNNAAITLSWLHVPSEASQSVPGKWHFDGEITYRLKSGDNHG